MQNYKTSVKYLNKIGAKYLGLSAQGLCMWSEWLLPNGKIVRVSLESRKPNISAGLPLGSERTAHLNLLLTEQ